MIAECGAFLILAALAVSGAAGAGRQEGAPAESDLTHDPRLSTAVTLKVDRAPVPALLLTIERAVGEKLSADKHMANERVIALVRAKPARAVLSRLAAIYQCVWVRSAPPDAPGYVLVRPEPVVDAEKRSRSAWRRKRDALRNARVQMLSNLMDSAVRAMDLPQDDRAAALAHDPYLGVSIQQDGGRALVASLRGLTPEERGAVAESAMADAGLMSATSNSYMLRNLAAVQPLSDLTADDRSRIASLAEGAGAKGDLSAAEVGFYAAEGALHLAVVNGQDVWAIPSAGLRSPDSPEEYEFARTALAAALAGKAGPGASEEQARAQAASRYDEDWDAARFTDLKLGEGIANRRIRLQDVAQRNYLFPFLAAIHEQTGLTVIGDGLLHASRTPLGDALPGIGETSVREACARLCLAFRRKIVERDGWLTVSSRNPAIYRLFEPPEELVAKWLATKKRVGLSFEEYAEMALLLSQEQIEELQQAPLNEASLRNEAIILARDMPAFRLWNGMTSEARAHLSGTGLHFADIDRPLRQEFWRLWVRGRPEADSTVPRQPEGWLQMVPKPPGCTWLLRAPISRVRLRTIVLPGFHGASASQQRPDAVNGLPPRSGQ